MVGVKLENVELARQRERTSADLEATQRALLMTQEQLIHSEQMAVVGRLASGIAHEVRNHLAPLMLADMLRQSYPDVPDIQDATELMLEAQDCIANLVGEIRRFASGAQAESLMTVTDLRAVIGNVIRFIRCDASVRVLQLDLVAPEPVIAECDVNRIRQVLLNLIRNASDAVDRASGHIVISVQQTDSTAVIEVRDNGGGIPPELSSRVFEPFFTTKSTHGLGLGLDISRNIVHSHGGTLSYSPAPDGGAIFHIEIPRAQSAHPG